MRAGFLQAALLLGAATGLAGCIGAGAPEPIEPAGAVGFDAPRVGHAFATATGGEPAFWTGRSLAADDPPGDWDPCWLTGCWPSPPPCMETNCERIPFTLDLPDRFWDAHTGGLEVSILWSRDEAAREFQVYLYDAREELVGMGRGGRGQVLLLDAAPAGAYEARVIATYGEGSYEGVVQLEARAREAGPARDLLPDLVVLPPTDLGIRDPTWFGEGAALEAAGVQGCSAYETVEGQARRCLRFANRVGNVGEGPLEVRLVVQEGAKAVAGTGMHTQRVFRTDGAFTDRQAGPASYHPTHAHFHYDGLSAFAVYRYDLESGTRGDLYNTGHKGGVCLVHSGLVALGLPHTVPPDWSGTCFVPGFNAANVAWTGDPSETDWFMHLNSNWYDLYGWGLDDMYVDMTAAADGVYELVSSTNTDGSILESDITNNEASVVFRLTGNVVEALEP